MVYEVRDGENRGHSSMRPIAIGTLLLTLIVISARPSSGQQRRAHRQPSVPDGWKELKYVDPAPPPVLSEAERRRGYLVFQRPITEPVFAETHPLPYERVVQLTAFATPGEFEPVTLSLYPVRDLVDFTVRCSDLVAGTERIASAAVDVRLVTYWNIRYPRYASDGTYRRLPELLERVTLHSSPKGECQRWWLTVHVPERTKAGVYRGTVTLNDLRQREPYRIPIAIRVLPFRLKRDPSKHLSAYYYPRNRSLFTGRDDSFIDRATGNEYRSMIDHGLDMLPTFYLRIDRATRRITVDAADEVDRMLAMGFRGPLPVLGGNPIRVLYRETTPGGNVESHWRIDKRPPPEFYERITKLFRQFKRTAEQRGWPELICCPLDEVAPSSSDVGAKVYAAVKAAGIRTYATKDPKAPDARAYDDVVDVWCSQPFARPYASVIKDNRHEYWSYPNHNAGERKNRRIMCKGGRMTYGFGFWRSGYRVLIPWHWAWTMPPDPMDYLRTRQSGCGQRIDDFGAVIPAVYWECFREGFDDGRYLYTLQQAAWERTGAPDPACRQLVDQADRLLQETWDAIVVQERYLEDDMWPSGEFQARRWEMARLTEQLLEYPAVRRGTAPSVLVRRTDSPTPASMPGAADGRPNVDGTDTMEALDLGGRFDAWRAETPESSIAVTRPTSDANKGRGPAVLRWRVAVDHHHSGRSDGKYNVGWPRIRRAFSKGKLDMSTYDFLELVVRVDSNRDEVQDDVTKLGVSFSSHETGRLYEFQTDLGDRQHESIRLRFAIDDLVRAAGKGISPWKSMAYVQLFVSESNYAHGTKLQFDIERIRLLRYRHPMISKLEAPSVMTVPRKHLAISVDVMGTARAGTGPHRLVASLIDEGGTRRATASAELAATMRLAFDTADLAPGHYRIETIIESPEARYRGPSQEVRSLRGPIGRSDLHGR